jgi:predicted nucleic acid-binding protein
MSDHGRALEMLEQLWRRSDRLRVTAAVARRAGDLAEQHGLRGYDAVHLASFETIASEDTLLVTFDDDLRRAARATGFTIAPAR